MLTEGDAVLKNKKNIKVSGRKRRSKKKSGVRTGLVRIMREYGIRQPRHKGYFA